MSQDLLSEFDSFYQPPKKPVSQNNTPPPPPPPPSYVTTRNSISSDNNNAFNFGNRYRANTNATTFDDLLGIADTGLHSNPRGSAAVRPPRPTSLHPSRKPQFGHRVSNDPYTSGLFDFAPQRGTSTSDLYSHDGFDDFGGFETARMPPPPVSRFSRGHLHSQSLFDDFGSSSSPTRQSWAPLQKPALLIDPSPLVDNSSPSSPPDDDFGDFVASPNHTPKPGPAQFLPQRSRPTSTSSARSSHPSAFEFPVRPELDIALKPLSRGQQRPPPPPPPEEFPPVAALLQSLAPMFLLPQTHLLEKLKGLPFPLRLRVLAHPKTKEFLEGVCELGRVAGRIIAGRRRRTRGNTPLPGRGSGGGGMRLGANTNLEGQKEEREVKEACRIWKEEAGRLKAAAGEGVPEIEEEWRVAPGRGEACKLCRLEWEELVPGLRERNERDGWWDRRWGGHGGCRRFWERCGKEVGRVRY